MGYRIKRSLVCMGAVLSLTVVASAQQILEAQGKLDPGALSGGKVAVLIFVRTDCPISNRYAPEIQRLAAKYQDKAAFWLIYPSKTDTAEVISKYLHDYGYTTEKAIRDPDRVLVSRAHVEITPEAAVFNSRGSLVYHGRIDNWYEAFGRARSAPTTHDLDDALAAVVDGREPSIAVTQAVGCYISYLQ